MLEPAIRSASGITTIELRSIAIGDAGTVAIASALQAATKLRYLILGSNGIGDTGASAIAASLGGWQDLLTLSMSGNQIETAGAAALGQAICSYLTLSLLSLQFNPINDGGFQALCEELKRNTSLATVLLENCQCTAAGLRFVHELAPASLTQLYLGKNAVGDQGAHNIATTLHDSAVSLVGLNCCGLGPPGAASLAEELEVNVSLTVLALDGNAVQDEGAIALARGLRRNAALTAINLSENRIGDAGAEAIASALVHNATLRELTLTKNQIGSIGCTAFCDNLQDRHSLLQLLLEDNPISEDDRGNLRDTFRQSTIFVDVADSLIDSFDGTVATTISAAIKGARDNTASSISILDDNLTMEAWDYLMQVLAVNTSVTSFNFDTSPDYPGFKSEDWGTTLMARSPMF
eukprot:m.293995 g.293995  ORF g.293995 m.293995 type:complete len:407 (+) comp16248_c3_seq1:151-1371(+)